MPVTLDKIDLRNWSGGLNRSKSDFEIGDNELWTAENCFLDSAAIIKRKGYAKLNEDPLIEDTELEVLSVYYFAGYILANCGTTIFKITTSGDVTELVTGDTFLTAGYPVSYAVYNGVVYMSNGKDRPWKWNGTDAAEQLADALPKAKWLVVHRDKLFYVATADNPNYVYFSQAGSPETIDADAFFIVYTDDNQDLTGAASLFGYLMLFKESSMHRLAGASKAQLTLASNLISAHPRIGCVAANTIIHVPSGLMFVSNDGVQFTDTTGVIKRSTKVDYFFERLAEAYKDKCAAFWDGKRYRESHPTGTNQYPNESLVYDLDFGCWSLFTYGMNAYDRAPNGVIYAASSGGQVYIIDSGLSDDGTPIEMKVETKVHDIASPNIVKIFRKMGINFYRTAATLEFSLIVDRGLTTWISEFEVATGLSFWDLSNWATSEGTVTVTNGSPNVTGADDPAHLPLRPLDWTEVSPGDFFQVNGEDAVYVIKTVNAGAKTLVLETDYGGADGAGKTYVIWDADTLFWIDPTLSYKNISLPKRLKGKNMQVQLKESGDSSEIEIYSMDFGYLPTRSVR